MKTRFPLSLFAAFCILLIMACNFGSAGQNPSAGASPPLSGPPEGNSGNPPAGDLSGAAMLQVETASFAAYPWRMKENVLTKESQQTVTGLVEAQSSTRVHTQSVQNISGYDVTIDAILIDSTLYMKGTGGPAEYYQQFGAAEGQWTQIPPDHPLAAYAELARLAADPPKLVEMLAKDNAELFNQSDMNQKLIKAVGSESVNGVSTTIYEYQGQTAAYRWWIGADGRIYKLTSDSATAATTVLIEYDSSINIQPPIQ